MTKDDLLKQFEESLPTMWERTETTELTGGIVNHRTLANRMCLGTGPEGTFKIGRKVIITRGPFIEWFAAQLEPNGK